MVFRGTRDLSVILGTPDSLGSLDTAQFQGLVATQDSVDFAGCLVIQVFAD